MAAEASNPLLLDWSNEPFHMPPFAKIKPEHFRPAFDESMLRALADLKQIVNGEPSFENTIAAFDRSGGTLTKVSEVFYNLCRCVGTPELQAVQSEMAPILSRHSTATYTYPGLFEQIDTVYGKRHSLNLTPEQVRLTERLHLDFRRAGAAFDDADKKEHAAVMEELATLHTQFQQNVMKDEEAFFLVLKESDLTGLPDTLKQAARAAADERGRPAEDYVITLSRSLVEPFLVFSERRDLREQAFRLWTRRGELEQTRNNKSIAEQILKLRQKQAKLHKHNSFAAFQCEDTMAKTPEAVNSLLERVWERAKVSADKERKALENFVCDSGDVLTDGIQAWDWRFYAERVRKSKYNFDEAELKPYLSLDAMTEAVMAVSSKLYGLTYKKRIDIKSYHEDVSTYEVREGDDLRAVFMADNYARPAKSSGAWMSELRSQSKNQVEGAPAIEQVPLVMNNNNFCKPGKDEPCLLSFDDATTLFHEMGHAHHGMLSDCTYARLASTNVLTDFLELPSQLMEHWVKNPEVLKLYAKHYETGATVPDELLQRREAAASFNQGFATIEYTACALLDMKLHMVDDYESFDLTKFEEAELARLGMPQGVVMRHRPTHFQHLFAGSHYAAGYFVYLWAETLDADAFAAFEETGDVFDAETAKKCREWIYSKGNTVDPQELFRKFRGRDPDISFMLRKKGLE